MNWIAWRDVSQLNTDIHAMRSGSDVFISTDIRSYDSNVSHEILNILVDELKDMWDGESYLLNAAFHADLSGASEG
jgi:hypothetical protein